MIKRSLLLVIGLVCTALGVIGLILPIFPGVIFLLLAAACFAGVFPSVRQRLSSHPRMDRFFHRLDRAHHLSPLPRIKLTVLAAIETLTPAKPKL